MRRMLFAVVAVAAIASVAEARPRASRPADPSAAWLHQHAIALRSAEASADDSDLQPFLPLVANARIIALSDATHGTHELFSLKQRLVPFLVAHANVRTIAFEAPYGNFERISDYVRTGSGDPAAILRSSDYFFWDTDEVLALIRWARTWNAAGNPPVDIVGVDPFHADVSAGRVLDFLGRVDPDAAQSAAPSYECMLRYGANAYGYPLTTQAYRNTCRTGVAAVLASMEENRVAYSVVAGASDAEDAIHAAENVRLGEGLVGSGLGNRDEAMAANIEWLAERSGSGTVLVWGHNEHFGKQPYTFYDANGTMSAGAILANRYGRAYVAIGSVVGSGTFNAIEYDNGASHIGPVAVDQPSTDDWASLFAQSGSLAMVPLNGMIPPSFAQARPMRVAGTGIVSRTQSMKTLSEILPNRFDAIIYVDTSTATHLRHASQ